MSEQLVLHHTYALGQAFDVSEHGNHGELLGGVAPTPFDGEAGTLEFFTSDGRVLVQPRRASPGCGRYAPTRASRCARRS